MTTWMRASAGRGRMFMGNLFQNGNSSSFLVGKCVMDCVAAETKMASSVNFAIDFRAKI